MKLTFDEVPEVEGKASMSMVLLCTLIFRVDSGWSFIGFLGDENNWMLARVPSVAWTELFRFV